MDTIVLKDMEVWFRVGVTHAERASPQRLNVSVELDLDLRDAATSDELSKTTDYFELHQAIHQLGRNREWKLIEALAEDIATFAFKHGTAHTVRVEVKKFILPDTRYVGVRIVRTRYEEAPARSAGLES